MGPAYAFITAIVIGLLQTTGANQANARDRVALPFSCNVENGKLRVEPASEHSYTIVGQREQQSYTFCPIGEGGRCRTWMVHRFIVQCQGGRVTWPEVVAAAGGRDQSRATIENGQLLMRLGPRPGAQRDGACADVERGVGRTALGLPQCQNLRPSTVKGQIRTHILALPRGFAPLGLIGARVVLDIEPPPRATAVARLPTADTGFNSGGIALPAMPRYLADAVVSESLDPPATVKVESRDVLVAAGDRPVAVVAPTPQPPLPTVFVAAPVAAPAEPAPTPPLPIAWTPRAEAATLTAAREDVSVHVNDSIARMFAMLLVATAMLFATGMLLRRGTRRLIARRGAVSVMAGDDGDAPRAVALRTKAEGHIALIVSALDRLAMVAPLRNALARDLQSSERRLAVVIAAISTKNGVTSDAWTRARRRLERIAQDLDRLQQIADSAVSSLSGLNSVRALPRNKAEAYVCLGVTPGVSDAILKRLVEALRISWHPDLARSDAEREARDVRIKEINVAWDLITGKRASE